VIFKFFQDGGRLPSWIRCAHVSTTHEEHLVVFSWNRCSSFDNMHFLLFREFGLKMPIDAPKLGLLGI